MWRAMEAICAASIPYPERVDVVRLGCPAGHAGRRCRGHPIRMPSSSRCLAEGAGSEILVASQRMTDSPAKDEHRAASCGAAYHDQMTFLGLPASRHGRARSATGTGPAISPSLPSPQTTF